MTTIYKHQLKITDRQNVSMPFGAELLSVQVQHNEVCLWAKVESNNHPQDRTIEIFGTGNPIYEDMGVSRKFIGTVQTHEGALVWHVFERTN